ncbi:hypothetical protein SAMN02745116_00504 [Pilibacter termitis]|uniref:GatB/YqeY domain-containing protein n=1 Tax=Pilibacter termitis TaxID=263852 RepID=A0A1T4L2D2_9ENTE|nr:GatB/YqeY domain-containing protein [Pilibacter termitis]SJZ48874.1 hypothetical protein SAMN02745116_00504 [Pilibacter termitis]
MTVKEKLTEDMKLAMKAKEKERLQVIRMLRAAFQNEEIKLGHELNDEEELTILSREMKQRRDSLEEFTKANREDLIEKVTVEIAVVEEYLPKQLSDEEVANIVDEAIQQTGATSKADFGKVMALVMPKVKGVADGGKVNMLVKEKLS